MPLFERATLILSALSSLSYVLGAPSAENIALAKKYAPQFRFHKDEIYFPSTVDFFLAGPVSLYDTNGPLAGAPSPLTPSNLDSTANQGTGTYITTDINANLNGFLRGQDPRTSQPKSYVFIAPKANGVVDLFYWIFAPYNLSKKVGVLGWVGNHVGDWERITVRTVNGVAESVDYHAHGDAGSGTIPYAQAPKFSDDRPVAYVSKGSHGMWSSAGTFTYVNAVIFQLKDETSDGGVYWDTQNALYNLNYPDTYTGADSWLNFLGDWGNEGVNNCWWYIIHKECELIDGPNGPARADTLGAAKRKREVSANVLVDNLRMDAPLLHTLATVSTDTSSYTIHLDASGARSVAVEQVCASASSNATKPMEDTDVPLPKLKYTTSYAYVPAQSGMQQYTVTIPACESGSFITSYSAGVCKEESQCKYGERRRVRAFSSDPTILGPKIASAVTLHDLDNWVV